MVLILPIQVTRPDGTHVSIPLQAPRQAATLSLDGKALEFSIPDDRHLYLSSKGDSNFATPPQKDPLSLRPNTEYMLEGKCSLEGGSAALWIIEYDPAARLTHQRLQLAGGHFHLSWRTHRACASCCVAVRLSGTGRLELGNLTLSLPAGDHAAPPRRPEAAASADVRCGPRGNFQAYSIFLDPAGDRPYSEAHHRFYDDRAPAWYNKVIEPLRACAGVLDIGCGPGLLMQALQAAGVARVVGVERDPHYLQACRERGLSVFEHDLNQPLPFIESECFDGIMAHQVFDYLAPIAIRGILREARRILKPEGLLCIASRSDGQASGDVTRTVPLTPDLIARFLREAGLEPSQIQTGPRGFSLHARRVGEPGRWPTRTVRLQTGHQVPPWSSPQPILSPVPRAWDRLSRRDFALLTTPDKREVRVDGKLVAYYTGYQDVDGVTRRAICRAVSEDGVSWERDPENPVLEAGPPDGWEGLAAGSVIAFDDSSAAPYVMFYSGRRADGIWTGVAVARSQDGIRWKKDPEPILTIEDYPGFKHVALADVIRTSAGHWLMHCEGWIENGGWSVVQARSPDGFHWQPTQPRPVIHPAQISWGGTHAANPKCLEIDTGHFILGFNAADTSLGFQLGLAESRDGLNWTFLDANPLICAGTDEYRIESFFMSRDAWDRSDRRVYFFRSSTKSTEKSSEIVTARADPQASWISADWTSKRYGLYQVRDHRLVARPGAMHDDHALARIVPLDAETQCSFRIERGSPSRGSVALRLAGGENPWELEIRGDGQCAMDGNVVVPPAPQGEAPSICLRVLGPRSSSPEVSLLVWHGHKPVLDEQRAIGCIPERLRISVQVPPGQPDLVVEHLDVWQPETLPVEADGDAHQYMGVTRCGDPLLPDLSVDVIVRRLERDGIDRSLFVPYGSSRPMDTYDQICGLAKQSTARIYPLCRSRRFDPSDEAGQFQVLQAEVLWQEGLLYGFKIHLGTDQPPSEPLLDWIERRQVLTMWHLTRLEQFAWLEDNVLRRHTFPVLLSHFGGYPLDRARYEAAINLLDRYPQLYLVTSCVWFEPYLRQAVQRHPDRILFGSDSPAVNPAAARATLLELDAPAEHKTLVLSENLRFLTERVQWHRWKALQEPASLMFPRLPATEADLAAQGFEVVAPDSLPTSEPDSAKAFWGQRGKVSWYERNQPWRAMVADLVKDLGVRSVLEFGCNVGQNLAAIHKACPDVKLVGLDINPEAVELGREKTGLDLRVGDEHALDTFAAGEFDLVFTVSVLDHVANVSDVCRRLMRAAGRYAYFLEVRLPVEGRVERHYDHHHGCVRSSTGASYSWHLEKLLNASPRVWRLDQRPVYLHSASLGPYYHGFLAFLEEAV